MNLGNNSEGSPEIFVSTEFGDVPLRYSSKYFVAGGGSGRWSDYIEGSTPVEEEQPGFELPTSINAACTANLGGALSVTSARDEAGSIMFDYIIGSNWQIDGQYTISKGFDVVETGACSALWTDYTKTATADVSPRFSGGTVGGILETSSVPIADLSSYQGSGYLYDPVDLESMIGALETSVSFGGTATWSHPTFGDLDISNVFRQVDGSLNLQNDRYWGDVIEG